MIIPPVFDAAVYRNLHQDLTRFNDTQLLEHYVKYGRYEGRISNGLVDRKAFASLITSESEALEIGPFASPMLNGNNVSYCDVLNREELIERATSLGINPSSVPPIHYELGMSLLDGIPKKFDAILSSHSIEHQPDLIRHLKQVERRLNANGRYFALVPDKRYCFDRFIAPSTIAEVMQAYEEKRVIHSLRSIIEHRALTVHNDSYRHWTENVTQYPAISSEAVLEAIDKWKAANGKYIDVHAWYFTPDSFLQIISLLNNLRLVTLKVEAIYPTRRYANEFWVILKNGNCSSDLKIIFAHRETAFEDGKPLDVRKFDNLKRLIHQTIAKIFRK